MESPHDDLTTEALFRRHGRFVARLLHRLGFEPAERDDLLQEVFLVVHRNGGYRSGPAKPTTYLAAIAVRVATTHRRKRKTRSFVASNESAVQRAGSAAHDPAQVAETRDELRRVQRAIARLSADRRAVFVLFELEGMACADIAVALDVPVGTVYSRLHAARKRFHQALRRELGGAERIPLVKRGRDERGLTTSR